MFLATTEVCAINKEESIYGGDSWYAQYDVSTLSACEMLCNDDARCVAASKVDLYTGQKCNLYTEGTVRRQNNDLSTHLTKTCKRSK